LCTAQPTFVATEEWPHREKAPPQVFSVFLATGTTRVRPAEVLKSRSGGTSAKRGEVSPLIYRVNREFVVRGVGGVNLTCTITSNKRAERLVEQRCVIRSGTQSPSLLQ
jgi:hypothetical protein